MTYNEKFLNYGIEDEVEAFTFATYFSSYGNPSVLTDEAWVRAQYVTEINSNGQPINVFPVSTFGKIH